jgi:hypothetical protein
MYVKIDEYYMKCKELCKLLHYEMWPYCSCGERHYLTMEGNDFDGSVLAQRC